MEDCLNSDTPKHTHELKAEKDVVYTKAVWGPKNETIIISTQHGKLIKYDIESARIMFESAPHKGEIFSLDMTYDYTMLMTGSRDGYAKLVNPDDLNEVKAYHYGKPCRSAMISPLFDSDQH